jgi:dihydrofolate synthase / folylpolyglutamate synthase
MNSFITQSGWEEIGLSRKFHKNLTAFLENKPLFYDKIDYERFPRIYEKIKKHLSFSNIIHIIGTNGKGTTGRFLAAGLHANGLCVGHYTSPHILKFNERIWINGKDITDTALEAAHNKLYALLSQAESDALSYFEYTTLLAMVAFEGSDYIVLEAGLGGEFDATAVFDALLTVVTPIDYDHQAFLGDTIEAIAATKLRAIKHKAIMGLQKHQIVYAIAKSIAKEKSVEMIPLDAKRIKQTHYFQTAAERMGLAPYLQDNFALAMGALEILDIGFLESAFQEGALFGRLSPLTPNISLDVGHNPLAAEAIVKTLQNEKVTLVYNSYKDKDFKKILSILSPIIERVEIIEVKDGRIIDKSALEAVLCELGLPYGDFQSIQKDRKYLVFGSFAVAESFLKGYGG